MIKSNFVKFIPSSSKWIGLFFVVVSKCLKVGGRGGGDGGGSWAVFFSFITLFVVNYEKNYFESINWLKISLYP